MGQALSPGSRRRPHPPSSMAEGTQAGLLLSVPEPPALCPCGKPAPPAPGISDASFFQMQSFVWPLSIKQTCPKVRPCFLGWRRQPWRLGKLGSAGQRKCAGSRGNAGVCGPRSRSSSAVGVAGLDTTRPHAQLSSQVGPCDLITLLHVPAAPSFVELSGDHCGAPSSVGRCPASLGCLPHFSFFSKFLTFFRLKAYTVLLLTHLWKWEMARTHVG